MKNAKFITHPEHECPVLQNAWDNIKYNSRNRHLEPTKGILNVKRDFKLEQGVKRAVLRASALGVFDIFLNGERVGVKADDGVIYDELKPGWTDFRFRLFEFEYNVTDLLKKENVIVAEVSSGWWNGRITFGFYKSNPCAFVGEIEVEYLDGRHKIIASDESWDASICGPVLYADIWDGEYYDANIPKPCVKPQAHSWTSAVLFGGFTGEIVPHVGPTVRVKKELCLKPSSAVIYDGTVENGIDMGSIHIVSEKTGVNCESGSLTREQSIILDFGQEIVGRPVLRFKAKKGAKVEVFFAEMLNDSGNPSRGDDGPIGSLYIRNYRSALARILYVANGEGAEVYFPTHAFYGFRYLEIQCDEEIEILSVTAEVIGSDVTETGAFECDHPMVNQLYSNVVWGMRGNYLSIPTDCPQRDERLGWTCDTQVFCGAGSYLADISGFMRKWLGDARHSQIGHEGAYCDVVPRVFDWENNDANAAWADGCLIVPYRLWLMYGNTDVIAEHYQSMEDYMTYLERFGLEGGKLAYGDWLSYEKTDARYIAVCYYKHNADLMVKFSEILGKEDRAEYYRDLSDRIHKHWCEQYLSDGKLIYTTQTALLLSLAFDLIPKELRKETIELLRDVIVKNDYTLSTGFVGTAILNQTLASVELNDLCYDLLLQTKNPSWFYSINQGATTMWERWNSYTKEKGFGNVMMNSFNHYAYGAVAEWFYSGICGILPDESAPGFSHFVLHPSPDMRKSEEIPSGQKRIESASASYDSCRGTIKSAWSLTEGRYEYKFTVPNGTSARIEILCDADVLSFNGNEVKTQQLGAVHKNGRVCFEVTAGKYVVIA